MRIVMEYVVEVMVTQDNGVAKEYVMMTAVMVMELAGLLLADLAASEDNLPHSY